jgi:hypothetical protein
MRDLPNTKQECGSKYRKDEKDEEWNNERER